MRTKENEARIALAKRLFNCWLPRLAGDQIPFVHQQARPEHQDRYAEAESLFKRALEIREKAFAPEHPDIAWSLNTLGALRARQSRFAEAESLFDWPLAWIERFVRYFGIPAGEPER